ncbi:MAG: insulinase family protein [Cyclobacteriaceae bacterium]|jgi:predicted Zn-dependent peptidase|nr:insulinase family protein [Cyclobacteriaceae bacterium]
MLDRTSPPPFQHSTSFDLLTPETHTLGNGVDVILVRGGDQEAVKIELIFHSGRINETAKGIAYFAGTQLTKGTARHTSYQINSTFDFYGIHIEVAAGFDYTFITLYGMTRHIPAVLDLLIDILTNASYPQHELQQSIAIYQQNLKVNLERTSYLASRSFRQLVFGVNHPYGYDLEETHLKGITSDALLAFRKEYLRDFAAVISGRVTDELAASLFRALGQIPYHRNQVKGFQLHTPAKLQEHVEKEDAVQTSIRIGKMTIGRSHEDYAGFLLLNHLLGGFFGSRLMKNIREEKGLTYGIHSSIQTFRQATYFVIGADVNRENRQLTIDEVKREMQRLCDTPVGQEELEIARNHFIGSLQTEMNTPFAHADKHKVLYLYNLQADYFQQLIDRMLEANPRGLQELANNYFSVEDLFVVSAG